MNINSENLIIARESRGLTQKMLSEKIPGLSQGNLSRMEKGLLNISDEILNLIAFELNYPISFFYKDIKRMKDDSLFYRKRITMSQKSLLKLEARINIICYVIDELLEAIEIPQFSIPHVEMDGGMTPNNVAFSLRNYLKLPAGPIGYIVAVLEQHGVIVIFLDMEEKFDGLTKFTQKAQPVVMINSNMPDDRKRFSLAHELGHLVMHLRESSFVIDEQVAEIQANEFAAEFLLPERDIKRDLRNLKFHNLSSLKLYWKVSKAAIIKRAYDLNMISNSTYRYFLMILSKMGERKNEKELITIERPVIFKQLIDLHLNELGYSETEIERLLGIKYNELSDLLSISQTRKLRVVI